jgi:flagellar basal-body rod modification protein FlgD
MDQSSGATIVNINLNPSLTSPALTPKANSTSGSNSGTSPNSNTPAVDPLASENVFLQLFIAQLQNQDPTTPADPTQFVTQLAQFSNLEQSTQQTSDLNAILSQLQAYGTAGSSGSGATSNIPNS